MARQSQSLQELGRLANVGGDIRYGQEQKRLGRKAQSLLSRLTDRAARQAEGDPRKQNLLDLAKFGAKFIPGAGTAISAGLSMYDLLADQQRAKKAGIKVGNLGELANTPFASYIQQNVGALDDQVKQALRGQATSSLMSNLLSMGMQFASLPGAGKVAGDVQGEVVDATTDVVSKTAENVPTGIIEGQYFPQMNNAIDVQNVMKEPTTRLGQFLTGKGTEPSLLQKVGDKPWFEALSESVPGMQTAVNLAGHPILGKGKAGATWGDAALYGTPIINRLLTQMSAGTPTIPGMPGYQRKSLRRRIV